MKLGKYNIRTGFGGIGNMNFETRQVGGFKVVDIEGQIRISTQNDFKDYFDKLVKEQGDQTIVINMEGVGYMNSAGIGIIVDSYKKFKERSGRLILCNLVSDIQKLFEVTKLNKFIEIYRDEREAINKVTI